MATSTIRWLLVCFLFVGIAQGVQGEEAYEHSQPPTESECRPYIEKALKQLGTGEPPPPDVESREETEETPPEAQQDESAASSETTESTESDTDHAETAEESTEETAPGDDESAESKASAESVASVEEEGGASREKRATSIEEESESAEQGETGEEESVGDEASGKESASIEDGAASVEGEASVEEGTDSVEGAGSIEEGAASAEEGAASAEEGAASAEEGAASAEEGAASAEEGAASVEEGAASVEEGAASAEGADSVEGASSVEGHAESVEEGDESKGGSAEDAEEGAASTASGEDATSGEDSAGSTASAEDATGGEEGAASGEDVASGEEGAASTASGEDTASGEEAAASGEDETRTEQAGSTASGEDTVSGEEGAKASGEDATSGDEDEASTASGEDTASAEGEASDAAESKEDASKTSVEEAVSAEESTATVEGAAESAEGDKSAESVETDSTVVSEKSEEESKDTDSTETKESTEETKEESTETGESDKTADDSVASTTASVEDSDTVEKSSEQDSQETKDTSTESEEAEKSEEPEPEEEELIQEVEIPANLRSRSHITQLLHLDDEYAEKEMLLAKTIESTLKELKRVYDVAIKPLETLYKYRDLSNRHFGDPEIFSKPLVLFMGPWSGGKSSIINYLLGQEYQRASLRTGAEPSPAYFNILMWGDREEILDGTQLAADWTFSGLQKFGQGLLDRLKGLQLPNKLLEKVNIVEIPGILEVRKQVERLFPFNDACQWFIDRADIIFLVYDPSKLDVGPETEAILDQLKGREYQTRIILNKADQVKPEELMRVQGTLIWNISPLMSSTEPPVMYSTSLWSLPYEVGAPLRLLQAQERAFLRDLRDAVDKRVENKIASARRFAVRVRNHAKMVDCYLTTYYNHKSFFGDRKKISNDIIEKPQNYHIYEGLSTLTNISRYDLPDPDVYRDFFRLNALYDFPLLSSTCTYFRGCPINRLDVAIAYDLPELVGKYKKSVDEVLGRGQGKS